MITLATPIATGKVSVIPHVSVEEVPNVHLIRTGAVTPGCRLYAVAPSSRPHQISDRAFLSALEDNNRRRELLDWRDRGAVSVASFCDAFLCLPLSASPRRANRGGAWLA